MASMRDIKRRRASVESTSQITKAMKLVSTVKLQRAKQKAEQAKPYFNHMYDVMTSILSSTHNIQDPYIVGNPSKKKALILITSNRGLAGGYNNNIVKEVRTTLNSEDIVAYTIGKKGKDALTRYGIEIAADYSDVINEPMYRDAMDIGKVVLDAYVAGEVGEIYIAYTNFKNTVSHIPTVMKVLPLDSDEKSESGDSKDEYIMNFEPGEDEAFPIIIPKYVNSIIYGALIEAVASENGARMQAMDNATNNAEEMIEDLALKYNRARQGAITQELTEIIAGASAIS